MAISCSSQSTLLFAAIVVKAGARRATLAGPVPITTRIVATGVVLRDGCDGAFRDSGRRLGVWSNRAVAGRYGGGAPLWPEHRSMDGGRDNESLCSARVELGGAQMGLRALRRLKIRGLLVNRRGQIDRKLWPRSKALMDRSAPPLVLGLPRPCARAPLFASSGAAARARTRRPHGLRAPFPTRLVSFQELHSHKPHLQTADDAVSAPSPPPVTALTSSGGGSAPGVRHRRL